MTNTVDYLLMVRNSVPKVEQMKNNRGKPVANHFIIHANNGKYLQSYNSIIAFVPQEDEKIVLDSQYWDYSTTTSRHRNAFLGETTQETRKKIAKGEYITTNLN